MYKINRIKIIYRIFIVMVVVAVAVVFINKENVTKAGIDDTMSGWLWSSNVGWISLNSQNCVDLAPGTCDIVGIDYGVTSDEDGNVTGEAWSENFGWICFGSTCSGWAGLGNAPDGAASSAVYDGVKMSGWANVYSMGEEGWIKLQGPFAGGGGSGASCFGCNLEEATCDSCFTERSPDYGLTGDVCYDCSSCSDAGGYNICGSCDYCNEYGLIVDYQNNIRGWAWGGFASEIGTGWLKAYNATYSPLAWLQVKYGDIYSKGGITGVKAPYGRYNSTYCIQSSGAVTNFTSENSCEVTNLDPLVFPDATNLYTNILGRIDKSGILNSRYGEVVTINQADSDEQDLLTNMVSGSLGGKIYYFTGNLSIDNSVTFYNGSNNNGSGLIVVEGDLNINSNISYEANPVSKIKELASAGWIVKGNLNIAGAVTNAVGAYYVEGDDGINGNNAVFTGASSNQLKVYGLIIAPGYSFQRTYQSTSEGSEQIVYDGRALVNTPPGMEDLTRALPLWREAAP